MQKSKKVYVTRTQFIRLKTPCLKKRLSHALFRAIKNPINSYGKLQLSQRPYAFIWFSTLPKPYFLIGIGPFPNKKNKK